MNDSIVADKLDIKRRFVECLERKHSHTPTVDKIDAEIAGFCNCISNHLKNMSNLKRLETQTGIMQYICEHLEEEEQ